jgi:jasmonate ZIM domain-containing protein
MTIFYGGQVLVFNDFSAEKAKEIMLLAASKGSPLIANMIPKSADSATSYGNGMVQQENVQNPLYPIVNDLPLSRKASLTRFLEKRKDRITAKAPYQFSNLFSKADEKGRPWMGYGAQFPLQMERQV